MNPEEKMLEELLFDKKPKPVDEDYYESQQYYYDLYDNEVTEKIDISQL